VAIMNRNGSLNYAIINLLFLFDPANILIWLKGVISFSQNVLLMVSTKGTVRIGNIPLYDLTGVVSFLCCSLVQTYASHKWGSSVGIATGYGLDGRRIRV
jgi:hypothetical protein